MEDGSSMPLWGVFILLLWLNGIFYGFAAALRNISENDTQKKAEEGDKKAQMLMTLIDKPAQFVNAIPLIVMACGICFGTFLVPYVVDVFYPGNGIVRDFSCCNRYSGFSAGWYLSS